VLSPSALADQAYLQDGSLLVGSVLGVADGALKLETGFGGELAIPWAQVSGLATDGVYVVQLHSGAQVAGVFRVVDGAPMVYPSAEEGVPLALVEVAAIWPEGQEPAAAAPPAEEAAPAEEPAPKASWTGRAELGLNGQSGNKERFDVRGGFDLNRKTDLTRLNLYLKGDYAETNSLRSTNEVMAGARLEYDFSERTYVFGKIDLEYDEFENLDLRTTLTGGLGHFFVKREKIELKGWLGAGYEYEKFDENDEELAEIAASTDIRMLIRDGVERFVREELMRQFIGGGEEDSSMSDAVVELGYNYRQDLRKNFRFKHALTYYPSVDDPAKEYRLAADTALEFPLGKDPDWTLRTGIRHEYDNSPQIDVDRLDTTYYLNLGFNW